MADSDYAFTLSLTICEPCFDSQSNKISPPVIQWFLNSNLSDEISIEEVEALFGIKVRYYASLHLVTIPKKQFSTFVEINTMCGFDPALKGADVCEHFNLSWMEIFENPVKVFSAGKSKSDNLCSYTLLKKCTDHKIKQITLPAPIHNYKDATDATPVTDIQAEKQTSTFHIQNWLITVLVAFIIVLLSLVIHLSIKV